MQRHTAQFAQIAGKAIFAILIAVSLVALCIPVQAQDAPPAPPAPETQPPAADPNVPPADATAKPNGPDIVEIAMKEPRLRRLIEAIKAAGLIETLKGKGPFTVFAPTNSAFERLPKTVWDDLLKPENKEKLASLLKYHVVSGKVMAADVNNLKNGDTVKTVQGGTITVEKTSKLRLNNATLLRTDIVASNGVIHVIDIVLTPPPPATDTPAPAPAAAQEPANP